MKLTTLEQQSLQMALEYAICDYETNLQFLIDQRQYYKEEDTNVYKPCNEENIRVARQGLKGMQRASDKLLQEIK